MGDVKLTNNVAILNSIRANMSTEYQDRIPEATRNNIAEIGELLFQYEPDLNSFNNELINRIGMEWITRKDKFENPLKALKKGMMPFGTTIEEIYVGVAEAKTFDPEKAETEVFKRELGQVETAFHKQNRQEFYKCTISRAELKGAFISEFGLANLMDRKLASLVEGDELDEYLEMKAILTNAYTKGLIKPIVVSDVGDINKNIVKKLRALSTSMTFLSNKYNALGVITKTSRDNQVILLSPEIESEIDVDVLAVAFNMSKADFLSRVIIVDSFGDEESVFANVLGMIIDRDTLMVWDTLYETGSIYNPQGLYWNNLLHHWEILSMSFFTNALVLVRDNVNVTAVTVNPTTATVKRGKTYDFNAIVTGDESNAVTWTLSGNTSEETYIDGLGILHVAKNETVATNSLTVTATSIYDSGQQGTAQVSIIL